MFEGREGGGGEAVQRINGGEWIRRIYHNPGNAIAASRQGFGGRFWGKVWVASGAT